MQLEASVAIVLLCAAAVAPASPFIDVCREQSDLVVAGKLTFAWRERVANDRVRYHIEIKVSDVLHGQPPQEGKIWAKLERFERNAGDSLTWLKNGSRCVLFLKKSDEQWWHGADPWFQVQRYNAALVEQLRIRPPAGQ